MPAGETNGILVHNVAIPAPTTLSAATAAVDATHVVAVAGESIHWISDLLTDLHSDASLTDEAKAFYRSVYLAEQTKYISLLTGGSNTTTGGGATATTNIAATLTSNTKAKLPDKFNGNYDKLQLFTDNMKAYFDVTNTPSSKRAGVLRLNLTEAVQTVLTSTNSTTVWDTEDNILNALKFYAQPNKETAAMNKLKAVRMRGYKLKYYFEQFVQLCGEAKVNCDEQHYKDYFHSGLNNLVTRGGLRTQVLNLVYDNTQSIKDIYTTADKLMQSELGVNYETKTCPADSNEHHMDRF